MRLLFVDASTKLKTVRDLETKPRGGMVQSLFKVTDYLASRGHKVFVLSDIESAGKTQAGTMWIHEPVGQFDVLVANRGTGLGYPSIDARSRVLWTHDLPHNGFIPEPETIKRFAYTVFMSEYAERIWREFYRHIGRSVTIPNGVDKSVFYPREKQLDYLIYFSHPSRGLKKLPFIADAVNAAYPGIKFRSYSNAKTVYPGESGEDDHGEQYEVDGIGEHLERCEPLPTHRIAEEVGKAGLCVLPSGYPEICSNSVLQALASGTPVITTGGLGSTPEWVRHRKSGMLTKFQPADYMIHTLEMVRNVVEVLRDERLHRKLIKGALRTRIYDWSQIGARWEKLLGRCC
jgi:glycosyltransferase involved in cell wall biosynthesis